MKRFLITILFGIFFSFSIYAKENKNILIVYFSKTGTTETVAKQIQNETEGDLFKIEVVNPYPDEYRATTEQAKKRIGRKFLSCTKRKSSEFRKI